MRRLIPAAAALLLLASGCARLSQQQDMLAPRVTAPEPAAASPNVATGIQLAQTSSAPARSASNAATIARAQPAATPASAIGAGSAAGAATAGSSTSAGSAASAHPNAGSGTGATSVGSSASAESATGAHLDAGSGTGAAGAGSGMSGGSAAGAVTDAGDARSGAAGGAGAGAEASTTAGAGTAAGAGATAPPVAVVPTATRALLGPMAHEYETWNNCAPVTSEMVLSFYSIQKRQAVIAPILRPNPKNFSVRMDQIAGYVGQFGIESRPLIGGTLAQLKALISNNIPVVVEDQLSLQDDYGHFRVARGFDDGAGVIIFGDSYYGPTNRLAYPLYQELWKRHNDAFMPVYRPAQAALVQAILGENFDPATNARDALAASKQAVSQRPDDGFAWLNLGDDLYKAGQLPDAKAAWEHARTLRLTPRTLWYTIWPAAVYNQLGEYQQALNVVATPLATDPNNAEALLERGNAERGLGNTPAARADYSLAFQVDPSLLAAKQALASLAAG